MNRLILLRHGESMWNKKNLFTGWVDVPLSSAGIQEALQAGEKIKDLPIDLIFTTPLIRASMTAMLAMSLHSSGKTPVILHPGEGRLEEWGKFDSDSLQNEIIPVRVAWQLSERMYGELQGLNKEETRAKFGAEQVKIWRRSFSVAPPEGESLQMTAARTLPYFNDTILPLLQQGKNILIAAHGNSLRSIIMELDNLSEEAVLALEIPTGVPIFYEYNR